MGIVAFPLGLVGWRCGAEGCSTCLPAEKQGYLVSFIIPPINTALLIVPPGCLSEHAPL